MNQKQSRLVTQLKAGRKQTVVCYGTSLTAGGPWLQQLAAELERRYPGLATVVNSGEGSMWSNWGVDHLNERVIARKPDAVFIEFSINDAFLEYKTSVAQARANLVNMVERILAASKDCEIIVMIMNPPTGIHLEARPNIEAYNRMYRDVAAERHLPLIDHYPNWKQILDVDPARFAAYVPDGIHPNAVGCRAVVMPAILRGLGIGD